VIKLDPKALVRRLSPSATRSLEAAVGRAVGGQFYEVLPEHLLLALLESDAGDAAHLCKDYGIDRGAVLVRIERSLSLARTGNSARPLFARSLFDLVTQAWLLASVELSDSVVRSAHIVLAFALDTAAYSDEAYPELDALRPLELIRKTLDAALAHGPEAQEAPRAQGAKGQSAEQTPSQETLKKYTVSFTAQAREGKIDPAFGRHREIRQLIDILARRRKNNPIIVGEPGVGKTALVEGLAHAIVSGEVPDSLKNVELVGLDLGALQAGAGVRGEFEARLKAVIAEVRASAQPIIVFIDEAHTLIGAGGPQGGGDAANLLKPALARGELRTIAATTWAEFKKYFEKDAALERRFQPVKVDEPSEAVAIAMLRGLRPYYEKAHGMPIRDEALVAAVSLSRRYISGRQLPDKAVDLLDSAAARAKIELSARPEALRDLEEQTASLERAVDALRRDRSQGAAVDDAALRRMEGELEEIRARTQATHVDWQRERELVISTLEAQHQVAGGGAAAQGAAADLVRLKAELAGVRHGRESLVHGEADAGAVARVVQSWTGIPVGKQKTDALAAALDLEQRLGERVRGQDAAIRALAEAIRMSKAGVGNPDTPQGVLLFVGPSGVGKTETALALADALYGGERFLTTINMSEYQEKHSLSRLVGSPPGYVGYGEGGVLTEAVRQRPYSVVLLDECEKADLEVMNLFYQVFDKGTLSDGEGRQIDFRNTIVILTSNLASEAIMRMHASERPTTESVTSGIRPMLSAHFKPALLARMTIIPFAPMDPDVLNDIAAQKLAKVARRVEQTHGTKVVVGDGVLDSLVSLCHAADAGARNVDHVLRAHILPEVSRVLLGALVAGDAPHTLRIEVAAPGAFRVMAA
jgi:type VI secretion system protein VasG